MLQLSEQFREFFICDPKRNLEDADWWNGLITLDPHCFFISLLLFKYLNVRQSATFQGHWQQRKFHLQIEWIFQIEINFSPISSSSKSF